MLACFSSFYPDKRAQHAQTWAQLHRTHSAYLSLHTWGQSKAQVSTLQIAKQTSIGLGEKHHGRWQCPCFTLMVTSIHVVCLVLFCISITLGRGKKQAKYQSIITDTSALSQLAATDSRRSPTRRSIISALELSSESCTLCPSRRLS